MTAEPSGLMKWQGFVHREGAEKEYRLEHRLNGGPDSSVGIATDYGLDSPGSKPGGDEIFRSSRPALGPTQPPVQWVLGFSRGYRRPGLGADPPSSTEVLERVELYLYSP